VWGRAIIFIHAQLVDTTRCIKRAGMLRPSRRQARGSRRRTNWRKYSQKSRTATEIIVYYYNAFFSNSPHYLSIYFSPRRSLSPVKPRNKQCSSFNIIIIYKVFKQLSVWSRLHGRIHTV